MLFTLKYAYNLTGDIFAVHWYEQSLLFFLRFPKQPILMVGQEFYIFLIWKVATSVSEGYSQWNPVVDSLRDRENPVGRFLS